jgi:HSP20 family protein
MALVKWTPFGDLPAFRREVERLFDRFLGELPRLDLAGMGWTPHLDMTETKECLIVKAELPGLEVKDLDITISGNTLTLKGEKRQVREEQDEHHHLLERAYGTFTRTIDLPATVAADRIKAAFKNGVLIITLPKTEEAKRKAISIQID